MEVEQDFLYESVKTIRNLCDIAEICINIGRREFLPTILELLFQEAQGVVDDHCVKER
jgi:hypothetical protein